MGSVAVSFRDSIIYARSVGYADAERRTPLTADSRIRIGSITKTYTAALVLKAAGEYGLGIEKLPFNNPKGYFHSGRIENFIADYWYFPDEQLGLVTLSIATNINTDDIQMVLLQAAYRNPPELPDFDQVDGLTSEEFSRLKGTYFNNDTAYSITISSDGSSMIFQDSRAGQMYLPFTRKAGNTFEYEDIVLHFDPEKGEVTQVQGDFRGVFRKGE